MTGIKRVAAAAAAAFFIAAPASAQAVSPPALACPAAAPAAAGQRSDKVTVTGADKERFSFYFRTRQDAINDLYGRLHAACTVFDTGGRQVLDAQGRAMPVSVGEQEKTGAACAEILFTRLAGAADAIKAGLANADVKIDGLIPFWVVGFEYPASHLAADVKVHFRQAHGDGRRYAKTIDQLVEAVVVRTSYKGTAIAPFAPGDTQGAFKSDHYPYYGVVWPDLCDQLRTRPEPTYCGDFRKTHLRWTDVLEKTDRAHAGQFDPSSKASGRAE